MLYRTDYNNHTVVYIINIRFNTYYTINAVLCMLYVLNTHTALYILVNAHCTISANVYTLFSAC